MIDTRGSRRAISSPRWAVASRLPSSTNTISNEIPRGETALTIAACMGSMLSSSLKKGTMMESAGRVRLYGAPPKVVSVRSLNMENSNPPAAKQKRQFITRVVKYLHGGFQIIIPRITSPFGAAIVKWSADRLPAAEPLPKLVVDAAALRSAAFLARPIGARCDDVRGASR